MAATRGKIYYRHPELFKVKLILKNSRETFLLFCHFFNSWVRASVPRVIAGGQGYANESLAHS